MTVVATGGSERLIDVNAAVEFERLRLPSAF